MKKVFVFCLASLLAGALPLFAGASRQQGGSAAQGGKRSLRIEVFERAIPGCNPADNWSTDYVKQKFGIPNNVEVSYIPVPRAQEIDMLNILMAAGDAPDICLLYSTDVMYNYVKSNGVYAMDTYLETEAGKKLKAYLGDATLEFGRWDGKQYSLVARRLDQASVCTYIRKDWLDKLGLPLPTTRNEFYNALTAFKQRDPGGLGSQTIPLALDGLERGITWTASIILDSFLEPMTPQQLACYPDFYRPGMKDGLRFLNKLYNEGLVSPNFALDKDSSQYQRDTVSGKAGALVIDTNWPYLNSRHEEMEKTVPGALYVPIDPFENSRGERPKRGNPPAGMYMFVPRTSKSPDLVVDYLSWMSEPANSFALRYGVEGSNFKSLEGGIPTGIVPIAEAPDRYKFNGNDMRIILMGDDFGNKELNDRAKYNTNPRFGNYILESYRIGDNGLFYAPRIATPIVSEAALGSTVRDKGNELYVRSIICPPNQFDAVFDAYLKEYMDIGGTRIMEEKLAAWASEHK